MRASAPPRHSAETASATGRSERAAPAPPPGVVRVLHLSDLHFSKRLTNEGTVAYIVILCDRNSAILDMPIAFQLVCEVIGARQVAASASTMNKAVEYICRLQCKCIVLEMTRCLKDEMMCASTKRKNVEVHETLASPFAFRIFYQAFPGPKCYGRSLFGLVTDP